MGHKTLVQQKMGHERKKAESHWFRALHSWWWQLNRISPVLKIAADLFFLAMHTVFAPFDLNSEQLARRNNFHFYNLHRNKEAYKKKVENAERPFVLNAKSF